MKDVVADFIPCTFQTVLSNSLPCSILCAAWEACMCGYFHGAASKSILTMSFDSTFSCAPASNYYRKSGEINIQVGSKLFNNPGT